MLSATPALAAAQVPSPADSADFDWRPLTLAEAIPPPNPAAAPNPDAQPVLQEEAREGNTGALAKEAQNPVANLISLPIQWNASPSSQWAPRAVDPAAEANRTFNVVNVQPVIPFRLNDDWLLVSRTIVPVIQRPLAGSTDVIGIGDINPTVFLVPRSNSPVQFGLGPTLVIPSASDVQLSSQRWSAGPAAVAVLTRGPLVAGVLANNVWSFAGDGGRSVTADWTAPNGKGWTVPIGGGIGRIFRLGSQPFNASLQGFWNAVRPEVQGDNLLGPVTIRLQIQALFPTGG